MDNNGKIIPEIDEQNVSVQQENATFMIIGDKAYTSEIIEEYNRNAAAKTEEFNTNATNKTNDFNTNYDNKLKAFNDNTTTKTTDFDSHVTAQTTNFNNNAETATANFNKNVVLQTGEFNKNAVSYSQGIEENMKNIAATSNELHRLKTDVLETGEVTDTIVSIEDSAWSEMQELSVDGVCKQETTNGKNKLPNNAASKTSNGVTFTKNSDGTIIANGTATVSCFYNIISDNEVPIITTNLILSGCPLGGTSSSYKLRATYTDSSYSEDIGSSIKLKDEKVLQIVTIVITAGTTCDNLIFKPMISSDVGEYEPYTGGQPSPSPDYPQDISVLTGDIKLMSCNKNLFDKTDCVDGVALDDNGNLMNNTAYSTSNYRIINSNASMTVSGMDWGRICLYDETETFISLVTNHSTQDVSFNTPTNARYYRLSSTIDSLDNIQLEEKSTSSYFEEHQETSIVFDIPDDEFVGYINETYKDTLNVVYKSDGHYHLMLNKMIGKTILDGSENWNYDSNSKYFRDNTYVFEQIPLLMTSENKAMYSQLSNSFIVNKNWSGANSFRDNLNIQGEFYPVQNAGYKLAFRNLNFDNVDDFKSYLSSKNIIVVYPLETPYEVDLGIADTLLTFDEITNIFTDSNLLPIINVKYYRNFITTIQNLQVNDKALKQELVDINNRLTALETAQANLINDIPIEESEVTE